MCGILVYLKPEGVSQEDISCAIESLDLVSHRGPDGAGMMLVNTRSGLTKSIRLPDTPDDVPCDLNSPNEVESGQFNLVLGHRRLSIFDTSSAGHQPMRDDLGNLIVFNGEVYNFWEVRSELRSRGWEFETGTDTEVILKAYREFGADCVHRFNGMWAMVIYDASKKQLFLANDRFGVKPLYQYSSDVDHVWSSEIRQARPFPSFQAVVNETNTQLYLEQRILGYDESTLHKEVERFSPGHFQVIDPEHPGKGEMKQFFSVHKIQTQKWSLDDAIDQFRTLFESAVSLRTRSDVAWGVGLSGGLDSSSVLYFANKAMQANGGNSKPISFSAIFPGMEGDESEFVQKMGESLDTEMHTVNPYDIFTEEDFNKHLYHIEMPPRSASFYAQWKVSELARKTGVTVLLVGQGADEIFGGYHAHFYRYCRQLLLQGKWKTYLALVPEYAEIRRKDPGEIHRIAFNEVKMALKSKLGAYKSDHEVQKQWNSINNLRDFMKADFTTFKLPNFLMSDDRSSMAFGVETRHPFLDYRLVEFAYSLPEKMYIHQGWTKYLVREAMHELPDEIRWRRDKKGFTIPQTEINQRLLGAEHTSDKAFRRYCLNQIMNA